MTVALICLLVLCAVDTVWQMLYLLHMLQLTSYRNELFAAWGKEHEKEVLPARRLVGLAGLGVLLLCSVGRLLWAEVSPVVGVWIAVGLMAVTAATDFPRKAKKPLVVTGRIKRMMVTFGILRRYISFYIITDKLYCIYSKIAMDINSNTPQIDIHGAFFRYV